jgi:hypothetical protein
MRQRNIGWRLDYVLASEALAARAVTCPVLRDVGTSDHAPVVATFDRDDVGTHVSEEILREGPESHHNPAGTGTP